MDQLAGLTEEARQLALGSSEPITIRFARDVGRILAELASGESPQTRYHYYM